MTGRTDVDVPVVGGGQAGLGPGHQLARRTSPSLLIVDGPARERPPVRLRTRVLALTRHDRRPTGAVPAAGHQPVAPGRAAPHPATSDDPALTSGEAA